MREGFETVKKVLPRGVGPGECLGWDRDRSYRRYDRTWFPYPDLGVRIGRVRVSLHRPARLVARWPTNNRPDQDDTTDATLTPTPPESRRRRKSSTSSVTPPARDPFPIWYRR